MAHRLSSWLRTAGLACVAALAASCDGCGVVVYDIGPDAQNGDPLPSGETTTSGLILRVDGNRDLLYAVSLSAGVFRSIPQVDGGAWVQLSESPPRATSIAVDRNDPRHLIVGERAGDNANPATNRSGAWESSDAGDSWQNYLNPLSLSPACTSQAVPSVAISSSGTLVAATNCGVAIHPKSGPWSLARLPSGFPAGRVTAVAASETRVWARDDHYNLVWSDPSAQTFVFVPSKWPHPAAQATAVGDLGTLAVTDAVAVMVCLGEFVTINQTNDQNLTRLLIYDAEGRRWIDQKRITFEVRVDGHPVSRDALNDNGGTYTVGRRFAKAFQIGSGNVWGADRQLFVSNAQEVFRATQRRDDGTFAFERVVFTRYADGSMLPDWRGVVHSDLWDFHFAPDGAAWVAGDGGVAEILHDGTPGGEEWHLRNQSLHSHSVQALYVPFDESHLAYVTQDNDAWIKRSDAKWETPGGVDDGNFIAGDRGNPSSVLLVRQGDQSVLTGFGARLPTSGLTEDYGIVINGNGDFPKSPSAFRFIQSRRGESFAKLDAVMLAKLPLGWYDKDRVFHEVLPLNGKPYALLRNRDFEAHPSIAESPFQGWEIVDDDLPANPLGIWVAGAKDGPGAHDAPVYYLLASPAGSPTIFRRARGLRGPVWKPVPGQPTNIVADTTTFVDGEVRLAYRNGPIFVNPYDADVMYVLTSIGVMVSRNATAAVPTFTRESKLSESISGGGQYAFRSGVPGGNGEHVDVAVHNGGWPTETLSDMSFDYDDPTHVAASSPFTGAFVDLGSGWLDLGRELPRPQTPVVSIALVGHSLYVGTLGRGILRLDQIDEARPASRRAHPPRIGPTP